ncbi:hypothetical protein TPY_3708 [Sulfobacillus acidophilus TPY]|nr:hypothetical protein TPY_3708 [Sulfobacillus acidophilus TPY]
MHDSGWAVVTLFVILQELSTWCRLFHVALGLHPGRCAFTIVFPFTVMGPHRLLACHIPGRHAYPATKQTPEHALFTLGHC